MVFPPSSQNPFRSLPIPGRRLPGRPQKPANREQKERSEGMAESSIDLSLATFEDIIQELKRRKLIAALYVSRVKGQHYQQSADVPSEKSRTFYCTDASPTGAAVLFCDGIQHCLDAMDDIEPQALGA